MTTPGPAAVPQRLWRDIDVAPLDEFKGEASVSVLLDGDAGGSAATAEALARQTYPAELVDVIELGSGREPEGEIVILLAAGDEPEPDFIAAHARWHHAATDVVTFGSLGAGENEEEPLSLVVDLTRDFTDLAAGHHLAAAEGSVGMRRDLYAVAGGAGTAPLDVWRLDLAQRLHCAGAVFAGERAAHARGRPRGLARAVASAAAEGETLELQFPGAAALLGLPPWRVPASARRHRRAAVVVNVGVDGATPDEALTTVAGVLDGRLGDLELRVQAPEGSPAHAALAAAVEADPRASLAPSSLEGACEVPVQVKLPALAALDPRTLADLHELALGEGVGALHVTVPGAAPQDAMIEVFSTAAWRRSKRLAEAGGEAPEEVLGRLFGERWVSGVEVSTRRHGIDEPQVTEHGPLAAATDLDHERRAHLRFRERAEDMAERAATLDQRALSARLRARAERRAAQRVESRLPNAG